MAILPLPLHHLPVLLHLGGAPPQALPGLLVPLAPRERRPVELEGHELPAAGRGCRPGQDDQGRPEVVRRCQNSGLRQ